MRARVLVLAAFALAALATACTPTTYNPPTKFSTRYPTLGVSGPAASQLTLDDIRELKELARSRSDILKPLDDIEVVRPDEVHISSGRPWQRSPQMETKFNARKKNGRWY